MNVRLLLAALMISTNIFAQTNLVPNSQFNNGTGTTCSFCYNQSNSFGPNDWEVARLGSCGFLNGFCGYPGPEWQDDACLFPYIANNPSGNKYVFMQRDENASDCQDYADGIRVQLLANLKPNTYYTLRFRLSPSYLRSTHTILNSRRMKIVFSEWGVNWNSSFSSKLYFNIYPNSPLENWRNEEYTIATPTVWPIGQSFYNSLKYLVFIMENGAVAIDDIELYERCDNPLLLENKIYEYPQNPFQASYTLEAGNDVGAATPNGNVIAKGGSEINYNAGHEIYLLPGFEVENGANFIAEIKNCSQLSYRTSIDTLGITYFSSTEYLHCPIDTLHYIGIDGDTSYTSFQWDFGNGMTSSDKVVDVIYTTPGSYTVSVVVHDSLGYDTLSHQVVVDTCSSLRLKNPSSFVECSVFPNPTYDGVIHVTFTNAEQRKITIRILDIFGQLVEVIQTVGPKETIDLGKYNKGVYILEVDNGFIQKSFKIVQL